MEYFMAFVYWKNFISLNMNETSYKQNVLLTKQQAILLRSRRIHIYKHCYYYAETHAIRKT